MTAPLDDLPDHLLRQRAQEIRRRKAERLADLIRRMPESTVYGHTGPTDSGLTMDEVMGQTWTCEACRPVILPGYVKVKLHPGQTCKRCGREA